MKSYSFSDLMRSSGDVLDEALKAPVALTKRGKERLVIMPADQYHRLAGQPRTKVYSVDDMPPDVAAELLAELQSIVRAKSDS